MIKKILFTLCMAAACPLAHCSEPTKQKRLAEYMAVVNFDNLLFAQIASCKTMMKKSGESTRVLGKGSPPADEELSRSLDEIEISVMKLCDEAFPMEEARKIYADRIDSSLTSDELAKIIVFLKSPLGQKLAIARSDATSAWQADATIRMQKSMMVMRSEISERLTVALAKFKARVKAAK